MCDSEISNLIKNLHLLSLPSTLWAIHIDPKQEYLAILHVTANCEKVLVDKGVLITTENCILKTTISINDEIVQLPSTTTSRIETLSDLTNLIYALEDIRICLNANLNSKCSKYIFNNSSEVCDFCSFEDFRDSNSQTTTSLETFNFDDSESKDESEIKEEQKFLCTTCGKTFKYSSILDSHMLSHAPADDRPFKCKICTKSFTRKYNLNVHVRVHSGERPYICSKCGKTYSSRSNLSTHMNSAHCNEKRHHCELCEMTFVHPRLLRIHMRKHTGEKPFMCQVCGKLFSKNIHLTIHTRSHTGEKPYVCSVCGKKCTTTGNLNSHKKIHHK